MRSQRCRRAKSFARSSRPSESWDSRGRGTPCGSGSNSPPRAPRPRPPLLLMWPGKHALERPLHPAYVLAGTGEVVTYAQLNDRSNQLAQMFFDTGLRFGDHIAVLMENRVEYFEPCWAAQRSGLFFTCINSHFNADEVAYILDDCDAQV